MRDLIPSPVEFSILTQLKSPLTTRECTDAVRGAGHIAWAPGSVRKTLLRMLHVGTVDNLDGCWVRTRRGEQAHAEGAEFYRKLITPS